MIIDVLVNSCARPDILDVSVDTFLKHVSSKHKFRYVLLEDKVDSSERQKYGLEWIKANENMFDEIIYSEKKLGPGFFFAPVVSRCTSDYFFHLEDDNEFLVDINIDPVLDIMSKDDYIVEVILNRNDPKILPNSDKTNGLSLTKLPIYSVATGIFNTKMTKKLIDAAGWDQQLHEAGLLTPLSKKMNYRRFVWTDDKHYEHVGAVKGYRKGKWRKV